MKTVFRVGDLVKFRKDSWWLQRAANFRKRYSSDSLVLVVDDLVQSEQFFYGVVCGGDGEAHLWSHDQFDLVQSAGK
jgi:hypothetical protein